MTVKELIAALQQVDPNARVFMGYDGNVVVTEPESVEFIAAEEQMHTCWYRMNVGDVVILCNE